MYGMYGSDTVAVNRFRQFRSGRFDENIFHGVEIQLSEVVIK